MFDDLKLGYFVGIGIAREQIETLFLDFICLYFVSMYILNFRNPILEYSMVKTFWSFP